MREKHIPHRFKIRDMNSKDMKFISVLDELLKLNFFKKI